jgi:hypothetical protein
VQKLTLYNTLSYASVKLGRIEETSIHFELLTQTVENSSNPKGIQTKNKSSHKEKYLSAVWLVVNRTFPPPQITFIGHA